MHLTIEIDFHQFFSGHDWDDSGASCHASPLRLSARRRATDTLFVEACVAQILFPRFRSCALSLHVFFLVMLTLLTSTRPIRVILFYEPFWKTCLVSNHHITTYSELKPDSSCRRAQIMARRAMVSFGQWVATWLKSSIPLAYLSRDRRHAWKYVSPISATARTCKASKRTRLTWISQGFQCVHIECVSIGPEPSFRKHLRDDSNSTANRFRIKEKSLSSQGCAPRINESIIDSSQNYDLLPSKMVNQDDNEISLLFDNMMLFLLQ